jgi:hypothetical protein
MKMNLKGSSKTYIDRKIQKKHPSCLGFGGVEGRLLQKKEQIYKKCRKHLTRGEGMF